MTTYENITGRDFTTVFKNQDRWEVLIVDEGQRCECFRFALYVGISFLFVAVKSDSSLLFRKLNELRSNHRVIMTGVSVGSP